MQLSSGPSRAAATAAMLLISRSASTPAEPATALSKQRRSHQRTDSALLRLAWGNSHVAAEVAALAITLRLQKLCSHWGSDTCQDKLSSFGTSTASDARRPRLPHAKWPGARLGSAVPTPARRPPAGTGPSVSLCGSQTELSWGAFGRSPACARAESRRAARAFSSVGTWNILQVPWILVPVVETGHGG